MAGGAASSTSGQSLHPGSGGTPGNLFSLPFWLVGGAIGFSLVVSLIAAVFPPRAPHAGSHPGLRHD